MSGCVCNGLIRSWILRKYDVNRWIDYFRWWWSFLRWVVWRSEKFGGWNVNS